MTSTAARTTAAYMALRTAAAVADHHLQTSHQALHKADAGWKGHRAMAGHIASYAGTQALALIAADHLLGLGLKPSRITAALTFSAATHWFIDRRWPLRKLADATGKGGFYRAGEVCGSGAYALDQSAHHLMEAIAAVIAGRED